MKKIYASSVNPNNVTVVLINDCGTGMNYTNYNVASGHPNFDLIKEQVLNNEVEGLEELINISQAIVNWGNQSVEGYGRVTVENGQIKYAGQTIHNSLTNRILAMLKNGNDVNPLIRFLDNVQCNPLETAREELYDFLEGNNLPITEEGKFLAYKRVNEDYTDIYTGKMDNSPGQTVTMNRDKVDPCRYNECSAGLHFASLEYARDHYGSRSGGNRMVIVEIDPADVVAIPNDYNRQKGRTWKYTVIGEVSMEMLYDEDILENLTVVDTDEMNLNEETFEEFLSRKAKNQRRDSRGRFV